MQVIIIIKHAADDNILRIVDLAAVPREYTWRKCRLPAPNRIDKTMSLHFPLIRPLVQISSGPSGSELKECGGINIKDSPKSRLTVESPE